jgi:Putative polyhydroxyalkanoic acid system protein (PHA_gran_rgn)
MSQPLVLSIPHHLGRDEAVRRLKSGLDRAGRDFASVISIQQQVWTHNRLAFRVSALAQTAAGTIDVFDNAVRLELTLPWLLAKIADRFIPTIEQTGRLLLEHK